MATYPQDRFDSVPDDLLRSGAHRGSAQKGHGWVVFAGAALATGALIVAGLIGLAVIRGTIELPFFAAGKTSAPTLTSKPVVVPSINPALSITILNGTETPAVPGPVRSRSGPSSTPPPQAKASMPVAA